ncbi:TadE/TadG family type IV pilus assembly protein [Novosphingobium sp. PS1R-30]|uniref:TadE/TadG family type IV pilus assembly protein n=1 Tax=Novosphingobium anseongense TaxID=3133436 RepID=A0ABU8RYS5_9SPHN
MRKLKIFRQLLRDTKGTSVLEFAFIAPMLMAMLVSILQTALLYLAQDGLETAAEASGRLLMTGQSQQASWNAATFKNETCKALPPYLKCDGLMIDVQTVNSYSGATMTPPTLTYNNGNVSNSFTFSPGTGGAIVVVRLMYLWPVMPAPQGFSLANEPGSKRRLMATSVLKSETW